MFSMWGENTAWCHETSAPARVDEIKATQVGTTGGKFLAVKAVCQNFTALPVLYSPIDQTSWGPPYQVTSVFTYIYEDSSIENDDSSIENDDSSIEN